MIYDPLMATVTILVPSVGVVPTPNPQKHHVTKALHEARTSDASLGRFSSDLPKEQPAKNMGKKRKVYICMYSFHIFSLVILNGSEVFRKNGIDEVTEVAATVNSISA